MRRPVLSVGRRRSGAALGLPVPRRWGEGWGDVANRLLPACVFSLVLWARVQVAVEVYRLQGIDPLSLVGLLAMLHQLLGALFLVLLVGTYLVRGAPLKRCTRPGQVGLALLGTTGALACGFVPPLGGGPALLAVGTALAVAGAGIALWALAFLGRCVSVLPEVRGLVREGPYRWVRHPMYAGELLVALGVLLPFLGPLTGAALVTLFLVQVSRALWEERALASALPEYAAYRRHTWLLVPRLL